MELIQVRKKAQVTLPLSVRRKLGIEEGDLLEVQVRDGELVLKAKKLIDKDQAWFWTKRWQEGVRQADEDIKAGRVHDFPDAKAAIASLHAGVREERAKKKGKNSEASRGGSRIRPPSPNPKGARAGTDRAVESETRPYKKR